MEEFKINIARLAYGQHTFDWLVGEEFFTAFETPVVERGKLKVHAVLDKSPTVMTIALRIAGTVEMECDRTLRPFDHELHVDHRLHFQYGDEAAELDDDLYVIPRGAEQIDLAQHVYDFIGLALPMKRLHPDCATDDDDAAGVMVYSSDEEDEAEEDEAVDPRWQALRTLRNGTAGGPAE